MIKQVLDNFEDFNTPNKDQAPLLTTLVLLFLIIVVSTLIGSGILYGLCALKGVDFMSISDFLTDSSSSGDRNFLRSVIATNHVFTFVLPSLVFIYFYKKNKWKAYPLLNKLPSKSNLLIGAVLIVLAMPLAQYSYIIFKDASWLPEWARSIEDDTNELIMNLLSNKSIPELLFNLLVIAVIPAIGEELIFRGIIQKNIEQATRNPHVAIWLAAILFSAIHMQFEGFVSRMLLGAILGYLFYFSRNIWVPIFAHFVNNGFQVIGSFFIEDLALSMEDENAIAATLPAAIVSIVLVGLLMNFMKNYNRSDIEVV